MLAILNSLNAHNFPIYQPILMILLSKFMVHRALSDKTYLSLGLLSAVSSNATAGHTVQIYMHRIVNINLRGSLNQLALF